MTEETAGIDLVVEQLRIAEGVPLSSSETPVAARPRLRVPHQRRGRRARLPAGAGHRHACSSRPRAGRARRHRRGVGLGRPGAFDSLMAKLIVTAHAGRQAIARARRALAEFRIEGVPSVLPFHRAVMAHADFTSATRFKVHTRWIETDFNNQIPPFNARGHDEVEILVGRKVMRVRLPGLAAVGPAAEAIRMHEYSQGFGSAATGDTVTSPMQGTVVTVAVADGDEVEAGAVIAVVEAMKMENAVQAHKAARSPGSP